ncbi:MAG: hypothetical protein AzoDbin1_04787 [Azoarcus sp.]|nr:hypothetical protein [Azoarcus sp.]
MISSTPVDNPYPAETFLELTAQERSDIAFAHCDQSTDGPCSIPLHVALFFDGTNNNQERDRDGKRIGMSESRTKRPGMITYRPMKPEECCHSNIVRLFRAFPSDKRAQGLYRFYMPGVGTEFEQIGEPTESQEGKAFAKGGEARIVWGLVQVLNAIHITNHGGDVLYTDREAGALTEAYGREVGRIEQHGNGKGPTTVITHRKWFAPHLARLKAALAANPKPAIPSLTVSVFGFSRGAAQAAAFCHLFNELLETGRLVGITAKIGFLGVFDTVASVGGSASVARTLPLPAAVFDGHWAWANRILDPLPGTVLAGLHCIATHELRMNFPVTSLQGNIQEMFFPGVHSDVGGGYAPGEQGKSRGAQAALLSQIPLLHMYKAARKAGVPLTTLDDLEARDRIDFAVDPALASAWDAYVAALGKEGAWLRRHMELYYRWRAARLATLESTTSFGAASRQEQQDLRDANRMLAGDLEAVRKRLEGRPAHGSDPVPPPFTPADLARINKWHFDHAQARTPLDDWEQWVFKIFENPEPLPTAVEHFFDDYVHDSFAGFYLAGEATEYDKQVKVAEVMAKRPEARSDFEQKVHATTTRARQAQEKAAAGETLTAEESALAKEAEFGTPYPLMTDDDTDDLRNPLIKTQTATRREGGGYIIRRGYYPHTGFYYRRSIHENQFGASPPLSRSGARSPDQGSAVELAWSNDLQHDIHASRQELVPEQALPETGHAVV